MRLAGLAIASGHERVGIQLLVPLFESGKLDAYAEIVRLLKQQQGATWPVQDNEDILRKVFDAPGREVTAADQLLRERLIFGLIRKASEAEWLTLANHDVNESLTQWVEVAGRSLDVDGCNVRSGAAVLEHLKMLTSYRPKLNKADRQRYIDAMTLRVSCAPNR